MRFYIILILLFSTNCSIPSNKKQVKKSGSVTIKNVLIESVDFNRESIVKVDCSNFEDYFNKGVKYKVITDSDNLIEFDKLLTTLHKSKTGYVPDIRAKIIIFKNGFLNDTLCLSGGTSALYNGKPMVIDAVFMKFINKIK